MRSQTGTAGRQVGPGIYRLGTRYVNWYLVQDGDAFTLVDTGLPRYWDELPAVLSRLGRGLSDVRAVVITHHHPDHRGSIERASRSTGAPVLAHAGDHPYLRGEKSLPIKGLARFLWRPWFLRYLAHLVANGLRSADVVADVDGISDGVILDVPGRPRVVHVPGHTPGSAALLLESRRALLSGDALVTLDTARGHTGPCILTGAVTEDVEEAVRSLDRLESLPADLLLPGHGEPWSDGVGEAVRLARDRARGRRAGAGSR